MLPLLENGDRVKVDDCGQYHMATVIHDCRYESPFGRADERVWVLLDGGDNPLWFDVCEVELAA